MVAVTISQNQNRFEYLVHLSLAYLLAGTDPKRTLNIHSEYLDLCVIYNFSLVVEILKLQITHSVIFWIWLIVINNNIETS